MAEFKAECIAVDATSQQYFNALTDFPYWVKNTGQATVYIGPVDPNGNPTGLVNVNTGYPLEPGESIQITGHFGIGPDFPGFNTQSGLSEVRILALR